jgi:putative addiction module CopG family antidote
MGQTMLELSPQHQQFVDAQISAGLFQKPAEVVGAALDLLQQRQGEYEQLWSAIQQVERGNYSLFDPEDVKQRGRERKIQQ